MSDPKHLTGSFGGHLHHCVFLFLDEAFWAGKAEAEGRLKALATEPLITIEPKYVQTFKVRNTLHIMMASNNEWVVPAGHSSRRYAVFEVSGDRVEDFEYFNALNVELDGGGVEAMLWGLMRLKLRGWHPKQIYKTTALASQKALSLRGLDAWIETLLQEGVLPRSPTPGPAKYPNRALTRDLIEAAKEHDRYTTASKLARKLRDLIIIVNLT